MHNFSSRQKAECAERELKQRRRVYPRLVSDGRMSEQFAFEQIALMEAIRDDYKARAEAEEAKERLL